MGFVEETCNSIRTKVSEILTGKTVYYDNDPTTSNPDATHIRVYVMFGTGRHTSYGGTKRFRYEGMLTARVLTPLGQGDKESNQISDLIMDGLRNTTYENVWFKTPVPITEGRVDKYWVKSVEIPFYIYN